jgi:hypothetical protein
MEIFTAMHFLKRAMHPFRKGEKQLFLEIPFPYQRRGGG